MRSILNGRERYRIRFVIDPEGKVIYHEVGSVDILAVKRAIQKGMNERKPW